MEPFAVIVKMTTLEGMRQRAYDALADLVRSLDHDEPGTLEYVVLADKNNANVLWLYEFYADMVSFETHRKSPVLHAAQAAVKPLLVGNTYEVIKTKLLGGKGAPLPQSASVSEADAHKQLYLIIKLTAKSGMRDQVAEQISTLWEVMEAQPGTLAYLMHADNANTDVLWMYEVFADEAAFQAHRPAAKLGEVREKVRSYLLGDFDVARASLLGGKGMRRPPK